MCINKCILCNLNNFNNNLNVRSISPFNVFLKKFIYHCMERSSIIKKKKKKEFYFDIFSKHSYIRSFFLSFILKCDKKIREITLQLSYHPRVATVTEEGRIDTFFPRERNTSLIRPVIPSPIINHERD